MNNTDKKAPMAAAPMKYLPDGAVDWGNMWDAFCVLAKDGGPPHRGSMLYAQEDADAESENYRFASSEIVRGIYEVSGIHASPASTGWIAVKCPTAGMANWLAEAVQEENVQTRSEDALLFVPVGDYFTVKGEIKNVITAVAKTTHYWQDHVPTEVKRALTVEWRIRQAKAFIVGRLRRQPRDVDGVV